MFGQAPRLLEGYGAVVIKVPLSFVCAQLASFGPRDMQSITISHLGKLSMVSNMPAVTSQQSDVFGESVSLTFHS